MWPSLNVTMNDVTLQDPLGHTLSYDATMDTYLSNIPDIIALRQEVVDDERLALQLDRFQALAVDQVVLDIPTAPSDETLALLDRYPLPLLGRRRGRRQACNL